MSQGEHVIADYRATGLSLRAHPCALLRERLSAAKARFCMEVAAARNGTRLRTAGHRHRAPAPRHRQGHGVAALLIVEGVLQRSEEGIIHLVAERLADRTRWLAGLDAPLARADELPSPRRPPGHPRQERVVRKSRIFIKAAAREAALAERAIAL